MSNLVEINNITLGIKEYNGQRVITFKDIDRVHERPDGTARKAFNRNRKRLIENKDYFIIKPKTLKNIELGISCPIGISQVSPRGTTFITESGYLMIVKVFDDKLAWKVQRQLVNGYFKLKDTDYSSNNQLTQELITTLSFIKQRILLQTI